MVRPCTCRSLVSAVLALTIPAVALCGDWPRIPESERTLTQIADHPNAPAVVLFERGSIVFSRRSVSSYLQVYRRVKILRESGVGYGSISIPSTPYFRVKDVEGRTHLPDGRTVDLPEDAVFSKSYSGFYRREVISVAMPRVTVGSIIEYRYKVFFDSIVYPEPWYFQSEIPVLHSEIVYYIPSSYRFKPYGGTLLRGRTIESRIEKKPKGLAVTFFMDNLIPIPDEPLRYPMEDLSSWVIVLPDLFDSGVFSMVLLADWDSAVDRIRGNSDYGYVFFRRRAGKAKSKAKELAAGADDPEGRARAIYRFVRDELVTEAGGGISVGRQTGNEVFESGRADFTEKALLLQLMLRKAKVPASLAWVRPVFLGHVRREVPNPYQFTRSLVVAKLGGKEVFLYPCDRRLAFGALPPSLEGVPCLVLDKGKPRWATTPVTPAGQSATVAKLHMHIDDKGRIRGNGTLTLTGHSAWSRLRWRDTRTERLTRWTEWLEDHMGGLSADGVELEEDVEGRSVTVRWTIGPADEDEAFDEIELPVTVPLTRSDNPFTLPPSKRLTPVLLQYPFAQSVELHVSWPEGWAVDVAPRFVNFANGAGRVSGTVWTDPERRTIEIATSRLIRRRDYPNASDYVQVHDLYEKLTANDEEELVLVREEPDR